MCSILNTSYVIAISGGVSLVLVEIRRNYEGRYNNVENLETNIHIHKEKKNRMESYDVVSGD